MITTSEQTLPDFLQWENLAMMVNHLFDNHYSVIDNFLSAEEVKAIRDVFYQHLDNGAFKAAGIGAQGEYQQNKAIRGDHIKWIDPATALPATLLYLQRVEHLKAYLNQTCYLGIKDFEAHFAVYPSGSFYKRHLDQFRNNDHRRISVICYLNEDWKPEHGGELRLYFTNEDGTESFLDITPDAGKLLIFRSEILEHEVLPAYKERCSITGWMLDQPQGLTFL